MPRPAALLLTVVAAAAADNLVFNGGFELGQAGFECVKYLRFESNPAMAYEGPVVEEAGAASGRRCLRLPNRHAEAIELYAREIRLRPDSEYTVSVQLRSARDGAPVQICFTSITPQKWKGPTIEATVGTSWQRVARTFRTEGDPRQEYALRIMSCWRADDPGADLWIDDLQVVPGGDQAFAPAAPVEIAAVPERTLCVLDGASGLAPTTLLAANHSGAPVRGTVALRLVEDGGGAVADAGTLPFELAAGEVRRLAHPIPVPRFGAYRIGIDARLDAAAATFGGDLTAIGRYRRQPIDPDTTFCVGVNAGIGLEINPNWDAQRKRSFKAEGGGPDDYMALLGEMGCRLARNWDSGDTFTWQAVEPVEGRFDFAYADLVVATTTRHGITPFPVLGGDAFLCPRNGAIHRGWPAWLRPKCRVREDVDEWLRRRGDALYLPPMELWRTYIRTVATRYKGVIRHAEILNEPNLYLRPDEYVPYLAAAAEELRRADPRMQVVGFCTTGDLGAHLGAFLEQCFALGGLQAVDGVSFHPYDGIDLSSPTPADRQIAGIRALAAKAGRGDVPLWNTELYYLRQGEDGMGGVQPRHVARRFLTDLGEGLRQSMPAHVDSLWRMTLNPSFGHPVVSSRWVPSANYVAYNALARIFEGAKPIAKHAWGSDTICYLYERDGRPLAACWSYGQAAGLRVSLPIPAADLRILDVLGNPVAPGPLAIGGSPLYLLYQGGDRAAFAKALREATIDLVQPLEIGPARLVPAGGGWAVAAGVRNLGNREVELSAGIRTGTVSASGPASVRVPALGETTLVVPVAVTGETPAKLPFRAFSDGRMWDAVTTLAPLPRRAAAAGAAQELTLSRPGAAPRHSADFTVALDGNSLRLAVTVRDATPSGPPGTRRPWEQDCIELFFDPAPAALPARKPEAYHDRMLRLFILPYAPEGKQVVAWAAAGKPVPAPGRCTVQIASGGYRAEIALPMDVLGMAAGGGAIGFEIAVDDAAGAALAASQIGWNAMSDAYRDRFRFGFITW